MRKAFLVLLVLVCVAVAAWNAYLLFTDQVDTLTGWIILAVSIGVLIWNVSVLRAYRVRTGTVVAVLVVVALIAVAVAAFAGTEPFAEVKDSLWFKVSGIFAVSDETAAQRTVRATIDAFNKGRGDRLVDLTTGRVYDELMEEYGWGILWGGFTIVDYKLSTLRSDQGAYEIRVRGGLRSGFGVEPYDRVFFVMRIGDQWIVTGIRS